MLLCARIRSVANDEPAFPLRHRPAATKLVALATHPQTCVVRRGITASLTGCPARGPLDCAVLWATDEYRLGVLGMYLSWFRGEPTQCRDSDWPRLVHNHPSTVQPSPPHPLLAELESARANADDRQVAAAEQAIVVEFLNVATTVAARHRGRGVDPDDLVQVARLGLVKAVRGWRPHPSGSFLSYAIPMMDGEVQRHIRDRSALIRLPRRVHELRPLLMDAQRTLEQRGQECTAEALAREAGVAVSEVREHWRSHIRSHPLSADALEDLHDRPELACAASDHARDLIEERIGLRTALRNLTDRQRNLLALRFFDDRSQLEIAREIGVSQMQVSRLLTQIFGALRTALGHPHSDVRSAS